MDLQYVYSESTVKPKEFEFGKTTVYFRKDITSEERQVNGEDTQTFYIYQEAKMPLNEFKKMADEQSSINAIKGANDSEKINDIKNAGLNNNDNQLIIMEAIADLYEAIATLQGGMST